LYRDDALVGGLHADQNDRAEHGHGGNANRHPLPHLHSIPLHAANPFGDLLSSKREDTSIFDSI
jgi:hypothetical protein